MDIVYGRNPVLEALKGRRRVEEILLADHQAPIIDRIVRLAAKKEIPVTKSTSEKLNQLSFGGVHQGVVAKVSAFEFQTAAKLIADLKAEDKAIVLLLDGITDPQNLGAIMRVAEIFTVDAIIIPPTRTAAITPVVAKASAGAVEHLTIVQANLSGVAARLKKVGFWLIGAEAGADNPIWDFDWPPKTVLVLGSEGRGLSRLMRANCDYLVSIPMFGHVSSLNVSVSAGILVYEFARNRRKNIKNGKGTDS